MGAGHPHIYIKTQGLYVMFKTTGTATFWYCFIYLLVGALKPTLLDSIFPFILLIVFIVFHYFSGNKI